VPEDLQKNKGLGKWAVKLLNRYSSEKLDNDTSQELINGEIRIPIGQNIGTSSGVATTAYMLVAFNRDKSLRASVDAEGILPRTQALNTCCGGTRFVTRLTSQPKPYQLPSCSRRSSSLDSFIGLIVVTEC